MKTIFNYLLTVFFLTGFLTPSLGSDDADKKLPHATMRIKGVAKMLEGYYGYPATGIIAVCTPKNFKQCLLAHWKVVRTLCNPHQDISLYCNGIHKVIKSFLFTTHDETIPYKEALKYAKVLMGLGAYYYFYTTNDMHKNAYCAGSLLFATNAFFNNYIQKNSFINFACTKTIKLFLS